MFDLGLTLEGKDFRLVILRYKAVLAGMIGQLLLLPLIAWGVAGALSLSPFFTIGLMLIACCPGGSSSNVFSMLARGDVALSVTLTALSSIITLFTIPPVMAFAARIVERHTETSIDLPVAKLILQNIVLLFLPMAAGAEAAERVSAVLKRVAFPALMLLAALFFLQYTREIIANIASLGAATAAMLLLSTGAGALLARSFRLGSSARRTIVIEIGMQNAAQAIAVASSPLVFNNGEMAIPAIVYALVMNVVLLAYLKMLR